MDCREHGFRALPVDIDAGASQPAARLWSEHQTEIMAVDCSKVIQRGGELCLEAYNFGDDIRIWQRRAWDFDDEGVLGRICHGSRSRVGAI
ncbi:hypothetical protein BOSEA1005_30787 [Hyphomicrobiales bacterium]|nr:hypothetical protein BOSEA1005_30787 [Hyphomicrobiales bacterium]